MRRNESRFQRLRLTLHVFSGALPQAQAESRAFGAKRNSKQTRLAVRPSSSRSHCWRTEKGCFGKLPKVRAGLA